MSGLIPVAEALARVLASVAAPVEAETVPLARAGGRTLAADVVASRTQPPFPASAMDGYAVRSADAAMVGATLRLIGTSAAGHGFPGRIGAGEAVRIFTGAPVPEGADAILIQEDAAAEAGAVRVLEPVEPARFIRRAGLDFTAGQTLIPAGTSLDARRLALAAAAGHPRLPVRRRPRVAILATGDELVEPGATPGWDQIVASNSLALGALAAEAGADIVDLGIAGDDHDALADAFRRARAARADLLVTLGGASVGDHDLVQAALAKEGLELGFWRVALRPGKPLMHGRLGDMLVIGLPGNPVSSIVCGLLFVVPAIRALQGDPRAGADRSEPATLGRDMPENDGRADYMRASLALEPGRLPVATAEQRQDSSMLAVLGRSEALLLRAPHAPAARAGDPCRIIRLDRRLL
ncbi:molybdopterin molybdotransferase [Methylobacterium sp. PvP062]|uniref:Molybdopterin molybdenumtransferase n=3 Tax=Pseudomonadota TaxID=1224 RepID=B1M5P9_METRJ|nr:MULTISPECIES: gephyrin-like molybdotransferase Glp [Methylobacterium]MCX7332979.1 molybdopterin molybdotransferase MoeA [Hyphomicrobiales bacterium]ACB25079.1 molybdenum cofactor synthesis domain protein [Methylobacterium radiotolerans JCM 2831]KIU32228.1 molybdenum cofactor biosynthesis protein MoaA [Methylobacterium radiotolerans]KTS10319.1 molybdenum cofactor biosynthesis protein MoaA [Methylobacterium radiotolerans]KTS49324.1 molybdenum cofactor biosynthesis protein MoaA [Methylobacteri